MRTPARLNTKHFLNALVRHEKARSDALFSSIGEGIIVTDEQGHVSRINKIAADMLGYTQQELLNKWYPTMVPAEDMHGNKYKNIDRPITRVFLTGKSVSERLYYIRQDGSRLPVFLTVAPVMLKDKPVGAIEVFRDITEELILTQAKDDFISIASHQLRTPATGVKQYLGMVLEGFAGSLTAEQKTLLSRAYSSNERQLKIIDDLLRVARIDAGHLQLQTQKVDVVQLIKDVLFEQLGKIKERRQTIKLSHDSPKIFAIIDPARIRMVLENLIDNASKYTPSDKNIRVGIAKQPNAVLISVEDEGIGISSNDTDKVFEKFTRIEQNLPHIADGSGLGLYWAKKIVDLHEGLITVKSAPKKGSIFIVSLPVKRKHIIR